MATPPIAVGGYTVFEDVRAAFIDRKADARLNILDYGADVGRKVVDRCGPDESPKFDLLDFVLEHRDVDEYVYVATTERGWISSFFSSNHTCFAAIRYAPEISQSEIYVKHARYPEVRSFLTAA